MINLKNKAKFSLKKAYVMAILLLFFKALIEQVFSKFDLFFKDEILLLLWLVPIYCSFILASSKGFFAGLGLIFYIAVFGVLFMFVFDNNADFSNAKTILSLQIYVAIHFFLCIIGSFSAWFYTKFQLKDKNGR